MVSIYSNVESNKRKTALLMLVFSIFVLLVAYAVASYLQNELIMIWAAAGAVFANFSAFWFSDKVALAASGARSADEKEYREVHRILENLAITAGLPKPKLYVIYDPAPNAFATGRDPKHAAIAITTGLLDTLDHSELEAVLAHELSHVGNRDILLMSVAVVLVGFIGIMVDMAWRMSWFSNSDRDNKNPLLFWLWIFVIILAPIVAKLMQLAISRKREFLADSSAVLLTRYPEALASALRKISSYDKPMQKASSATAHLFISDPFASSKTFTGQLRKLFSTHPPIQERIEALLGSKYDSKMN